MFAWLVLAAFLAAARAHECVHDSVQRLADVHMDPQRFDGEITEPRARAADVATAPLRVHFDTFYLGASDKDCKTVGQEVVVNNERFTCEERHILTRDAKNMLIRVLTDLKREIGEIFQIVRADELELSNYPWCYDNTIDFSRYKSSSNDPIRKEIDLMMMVTAWPTGGNTLAWASYCRTNQYGRAIGGHMNFGPAGLRTATYSEVHAVAMHELFHAMGFHAGRMRKMLSASGRVYDPVKSVRIGDAANGYKQVDMITSPNVVAAAREHYGCPTLEGQEIEDHAKQVEIGSHWEQRNMDFEVMTPQSATSNEIFGPRISRMTLAFFADLGYYYPDMRKATEFTYGRGQGCDFVQKAPRLRGDKYACPNPPTTINTCSPVLDGYSSCGGYRYQSPLSLFEQTDTSDPTRGGNQYSDYIIEAGSWSTCLTFNRASNSGETGGEGSRCVYSKIAQRGYISRSVSAGCYVHRCPNEPGYGGGFASAPQTSAPATAAPSGGSSSSDDYLRVSNCEACTTRGGQWCDGGSWSTRTGGYDRSGYCTSSDSSCGSSWTTVRSASQCYSSCVYGSRVGVCRDASQCAGRGGLSYASRAGASGCETDPGTVRCCIGASAATTSNTNRKRDVDDAEEVEEAKEVEQAGGVQIKVGSDWYTCPALGGTTNIGTRSTAYSGSIECPSVNDACCAHLNYCSGHGTCIHGHCACQGEYEGESCESLVAGPSGRAPSRVGWSVRNYAVEDVLPTIDTGATAPPREPETLPDVFGADVVQVDEDGNPIAVDDGSDSDSDGLADSDKTALIIGVIVAVVVLLAAGVAAFMFFAVRRRRAAASGSKNRRTRTGSFTRS